MLVAPAGLATVPRVASALLPAGVERLLSVRRRLVGLTDLEWGRRLLAPDERRAASASFLEASAAGVRGMIEDYLTYSRPWGFEASEVKADVHLWHGVNDPLVPIEHALQLAVTLPRCRVFFDPDEGHHFFRRRLRRILAVLVDRETDPGDGLATSLDVARALASERSALSLRGLR